MLFLISQLVTSSGRCSIESFRPCIIMVFPFLSLLATEFRSFLLYYPVVLCGILPDCYLAHLLLLSKAMRILLGNSISPSDLQLAQQLLDLFRKLHERYYGKFMCQFYVVSISCA